MKRGSGSASSAAAAGSLFGLPTPNAASPAKAGRKTKTTAEADGNDIDGLKDIVAMLGKLTLVANRKADVALAATSDVLVIKRDIQTATGGVLAEAGRIYHEMVQGLQPAERAKAGPPGLRVWEVLVTWCLEAAKEKDNQHVIEAVSAYTDKASSADNKMDWMAAGIRSCKLSKTYEKTTMKLEIVTGNCDEGIEARKLWTPMMRMLCSSYGAQRKCGPPPPSANQRGLVKAMREASMLGEESGASRHDW
eukprot:TRINITY_DN23725_c0_g2_i3.p2 TRINITY_DN23725_c0_g2~~TRINITY_DN23725_c0_g2_i3.p2  ORF type:complete len:250 (+),score=66.57 TRINITY_DN23725_c0_g2_i3:104-853(+)